MGIEIKDVTANAVRLTLDDNGYIGIGANAPIAQLTANGIAMCDGYARIINGRVISRTMQITEGWVSCPPSSLYGTVTVPTPSAWNRLPIASISCGQGIVNIIDNPDWENPDPFAEEYEWGASSEISGFVNGSFDIYHYGAIKASQPNPPEPPSENVRYHYI